MKPTEFSLSQGVIPDMKDSSPIDCFHLFFDAYVLELILTETTRYVSQYL